MKTAREDIPADRSPARKAVIRAFRELRLSGQPVRFALEAALIVYVWHHPRASGADARLVVETWVRDGALH
jgi:hypothetical protein